MSGGHFDYNQYRLKLSGMAYTLCYHQLIIKIMNTEEQIKKAEYNIKKRGLAKIVKHYNGFIVMARSERDYQSKINSINRGDIFGFYTVDVALSL